MTDSEIDSLLVLDLKPDEYFVGDGVSSYHSGACLFASNSDIIDWMISRENV